MNTKDVRKTTAHYKRRRCRLQVRGRIPKMNTAYHSLSKHSHNNKQMKNTDHNCDERKVMMPSAGASNNTWKRKIKIMPKMNTKD